MELSIPLNKINTQNIYFTDKKKNIIVDGDFIKILYSNEFFEMNGLYILFHLENTPRIIQEQNWVQIPNRTRKIYAFNVNSKESIETIDNLCKIEHNIIKRYIMTNCPSKTPSYILKTHLMNGIIKYNSEYKEIGYAGGESSPTKQYCKTILKISGVWETATNVGITMKFILCN